MIALFLALLVTVSTGLAPAGLSQSNTSNSNLEKAPVAIDEIKLSKDKKFLLVKDKFLTDNKLEKINYNPSVCYWMTGPGQPLVYKDSSGSKLATMTYKDIWQRESIVKKHGETTTDNPDFKEVQRHYDGNIYKPYSSYSVKISTCDLFMYYSYIHDIVPAQANWDYLQGKIKALHNDLGLKAVLNKLYQEDPLFINNAKKIANIVKKYSITILEDFAKELGKALIYGAETGVFGFIASAVTSLSFSLLLDTIELIGEHIQIQEEIADAKRLNKYLRYFLYWPDKIITDHHPEAVFDYKNMERYSDNFTRGLTFEAWDSPGPWDSVWWNVDTQNHTGHRRTNTQISVSYQGGGGTSIGATPLIWDQVCTPGSGPVSGSCRLGNKDEWQFLPV